VLDLGSRVIGDETRLWSAITSGSLHFKMKMGHGVIGSESNRIARLLPIVVVELVAAVAGSRSTSISD
jgi:hypothetical protein